MSRFALFLSLFILASCFKVMAQDDGTPVLSQECFSAAKAKAADTISGPQLTAVGTFTISNAPIVGASQFNFMKATATVWLYTFRSALDRSPIVILTYKSKLTGQCVALELPTDSAKVSHSNLNEKDIQSDSLMTELARNNTFTSILIQHQDLMADSVFLISSDEVDNNPFPPAANIWLITFHHSNGGKMTCVYDATNRTKSACAYVPTGVSDDPEVSHVALVSPSPATTYALVHLPSDQASQLRELKVYDSQGRSCFNEHNFAEKAFENVVLLPTQNLSSGSYFIHIVGAGSSYTVPLIVQH